MERRLSAILAADIIGYSRMMSEDEAGTLAALKALLAELIDPKSAQYGGRIIKLMGDGILMEFASVVDAVGFAVDVQWAMQARNDGLPPARQILYRVGINIGDVIVEDDDIYGDGVNVAARLESLSNAGGVCIERNVRDQIRDKLDLNLEDLGEVEVKNLLHPIHAFQIVMDEKAFVLSSPIAQDVARPKPVSRITIVAAASIIMLALGGAALWWQPWELVLKSISEEQLTVALPDKHSIAVLPFNNMSNDKNQDYFADGLAEDLITDLSKISALFVIARNTSFQYRGGSLDLKEIGRKLTVRYILEGSVRKSDDQLRINAQLIDATTGGHVWAERYDGSVANVFSVQDKITNQILEALKLQLTTIERQEVDTRGTENLVAYDAYLHGLRLLSSQKRIDVEGNRAAQAAFKEAIRIDPNYALAMAGLAWSRWLHISTIYAWEDTSKLLALAEKSIEGKDNALARRVLSRRHFALESEDIWTTRKPHLAVVELEAAKRLEPNNSDVLADLAKVLPFAGRPEEALDLIQKAMKLNPDHPDWYFGVSGIALLLTGESKRAVTHLRKWSENHSSYRIPYIFLAAALANAGDIAAAKAAVLRFNELYGSGSSTALYGIQYKWPLDEKQRKLFQSGLQLAGVK